MRPALVPLLLLATPAGAADPDPRVGVEMSPKNGAWVGQRVTLAVTLATPDLFAGVPSFDMPPIPGVVVLPPAGSPVIGSETVGDTTYTTQRHEFAVYAQRPDVVRVPAFPVRFETNAGFGKPTIRRQVTTEPVSFAAKSPPGADGLGTVIAAHDLKVADEWTPEPKNPKLGDAFTRTLTVTAGDVPGMVFPPFRVDKIDGLAAYAKEPIVADRTERGSLTGRRVEAVTYVCERPGPVTIPDRTLTWWDLDAKELKTLKLPGRTFEVAPNANAPMGSPPDALTETSTANGRWMPAVAGVGLTAVLGWLLVVRVWPWYGRVRRARARSEPAYFARFRRACRSHAPHAIYTALLAWLDRLGPVSLDEFTSRSGDPALAAVVSELKAVLYTRPGTVRPVEWSRAHELFARVATARRRFRSTARLPGGADLLPALNPNG